MKRICTRACIGTLYGTSAVNQTKLTFQIHAKDKVKFVKIMGRVVVGKIIKHKQAWYFTVPLEIANNNFGKYES